MDQDFGESQYTDEQILAFKEEFVKRRLRHRIVVAAVVPVLVVAGLVRSGFLRLPELWVLLLLTIIVAAIGLNLWIWRCPACNAWLGSAWGGVEYCPSCGLDLGGDLRLHL